MGFKQRVGNFLLLAGAIGLLIFAASVVTPPSHYDVTAFLVGALLFGLGLNFRMSKPSGASHASHEAHSVAHTGKPAAKGGPAKPAAGGGPPKGAPPKKQSPLAMVFKGPAVKKTAPAPPKPGGGGPPSGKK